VLGDDGSDLSMTVWVAVELVRKGREEAVAYVDD